MSISRQIRRAPERRAVKEARKAERNASATPSASEPPPLVPSAKPASVVPLEIPASSNEKLKLPAASLRSSDEAPLGTVRADVHLASDVDKSRPVPSSQPASVVRPASPGPTGPRTPEGKAISCLNNLKHGLTGAFRVLEFESQSDFDAAHNALIEEHQPATPTESQIIRRMAEHAWLSRRAQLLQDAALESGDDQRFSLFMRYQTTNDRGFRACLNDLFRLRREQRAAEREFESQNRAAELHDSRVRLANARAGHLELDTEVRSVVDAPLPGYSSVPLEQIKELFQAAMLSLKSEKGAKAAV
jgi:hypothetical protein